MLKITNLIKKIVISVTLFTIIFSSIGAGMYLFNDNPILDGNLIKVDSGYCIENDDCLLLSESGNELVFNPINKGGEVTSFQSNIQMEHLDESMRFVVWSLDTISISVDYELKQDVDKFYPLILHFDDFNDIISTSGISSERKIVFDPVEGIGLLNNDTFLFIHNLKNSNNIENSDVIFDMRVEDGKGLVLYVSMKNPPKKGHFIIRLENLNKNEGVEEQFNLYSNAYKNPPTVTMGETIYAPILIENSRKSTNTEVETRFSKSPLFIREGDPKKYEISFSSNKPVYVEGNIKTRLGEEVVDDTNFKQYFNDNYIYETSLLAPSKDVMPWEKESKLTVNLWYFYGSMQEGSNTFQTRLISNSFIKLTYIFYLFMVTFTFALIYGNYLKNMDQYPFYLAIILPIIFILIGLYMNDSALFYSGKINIQEPTIKSLLELPISFAFLVLFTLFAYHHSLSGKWVSLFVFSIPIFLINKIWFLLPIFLFTIEIIQYVPTMIQHFMKK